MPVTRCRLRVEPLEDRTTPAVFTVTTTADVVDSADGKLSLREAITAANGSGDPQITINFAAESAGATFTVSQIGGTSVGPAAFELTRSVSIQGSGQKIVRDAAAPHFRLFNLLDSSSAFILANVELLGGYSDGFGGAIYSRRTAVSVRNCLLAGNTAGGAGGAIYSQGGSLFVEVSTVTGNTARPGADGTSRGGGIFQELDAAASANHNTVISFSTLFNNSAGSGSQAYATAVGLSMISFYWSILYSTPVVGVNDLVAAGGTRSGLRNLIGSANEAVWGVISSADPKLGPLQDNGGRTRTMLPQPGSPVINVGPANAGSQTYLYDQRGYPTAGPARDLGAAEAGAIPPPVVTTPPIPVFATGAASGQSPEVRVYDVNGNRLKTFPAYDPRFLGGVSVTVADVTGDGTPDIVTGAGAGGGPHVKVFDGVTFAEVRSFYAYDAGFRGGVNVAAGLLGQSAVNNGVFMPGRYATIVTGAGPGAGPHVKSFDGATGAEVLSFYAFDPNFRGGVSVGVRSDQFVTSFLPTVFPGQIVVGAGPGGGPHVKGYFYSELNKSVTEIASFFAFDPGFRGGVNVATDGSNNIVTGAGAGGGPHVKVFTPSGDRELASFMAGSLADTGGVRIGYTSNDVDALLTLIPNASGNATVRRSRNRHVPQVTGTLLTTYTEDPFPSGTVDWGQAGSIGGLFAASFFVNRDG